MDATLLELSNPPWRVVLAVGGFGALSIGLWWRSLSRELSKKRRRVFNLCSSCGYPLSGNVSGICPECGTPTGPNEGGA